jgi:hypothetical protein
MALYDKVKDLPLEIESYGLEGLARAMSAERTRLTTIVHVYGAGEEGIGEDVTYDPDDQNAQLAAGSFLPLPGTYTIDTLSQRLDELDLFPKPPARESSVDFRRWAYESAALDLALRQSGASLVEVMGLDPHPVNFVNSFRLGEPASMETVVYRLGLYPGLRFKLDATPSWTDGIVAKLVETGAVDSVDFKGQYHGTVVDQPPDPALYRRVVEAFPEAWFEDPHTDPEVDAVLVPHRERVTWDAPIHSVSDIETLPYAPKMINVKPSRFGSLKSLFAAYDYCNEHGIGMYGGGQTELGQGRGQIQYLASIFHPDGPNDTAPSGYNDPKPAAGLPSSPLAPKAEPVGFRWQM